MGQKEYCVITNPVDTSRYGQPAVPVEKITEAVAPIAIERRIFGDFLPYQKTEVQELCYSSRVAGSLDVIAFKKGLAYVGLSDVPFCDTCIHKTS